MTSFFLADQKMGLIIYLIIHIIDIYSVYIQYIYVCVLSLYYLIIYCYICDIANYV